MSHGLVACPTADGMFTVYRYGTKYKVFDTMTAAEAFVEGYEAGYMTLQANIRDLLHVPTKRGKP